MTQSSLLLQTSVFSSARNKGAVRDDLQDPSRPKDTGPAILDDSEMYQQAKSTVQGTTLMGVCGVDGLVAGSVQLTFGPFPGCLFQAQGLLLVPAEIQPGGSSLVTGKLSSQETTGCRASQMDAAFPQQRKYSPGTRPLWLCEQTLKKSHPVAC